MSVPMNVTKHEHQRRERVDAERDVDESAFAPNHVGFAPIGIQVQSVATTPRGRGSRSTTRRSRGGPRGRTARRRSGRPGVDGRERDLVVVAVAARRGRRRAVVRRARAAWPAPCASPCAVRAVRGVLAAELRVRDEVEEPVDEEPDQREDGDPGQDGGGAHALSPSSRPRRRGSPSTSGGRAR